MFWELSSDKAGADNLVSIAAANIGALDTTPNHLYYPNSQFDNIKNNMGAGPGTPNTTVQPGTTTTKPPTTTTPVTSKTTSAPPTTTSVATGGCAGLAAWSSGIAYTGGQTVSYGGMFLYLFLLNFALNLLQGTSGLPSGGLRLIHQADLLGKYPSIHKEWNLIDLNYSSWTDNGAC